MSHTPVLLQEVLEILQPGPGKKFIDATANGGGHTTALRNAGAEVLPIEWDPVLAERLGAVNDNYANIERIANEYGFNPCDGVLFDLGFSSEQLEMGKGISFLKDEPLDMRYSNEGPTAADILNTSTEEEIAKILKEYGEERFDGRITRAIMERRPLHTTTDLVKAIESVVHRTGKLHPATRTFQALRIAVNHEFENIKQGIEGAMKIAPIVAVITFHSLEDRIVKQYTKKKIKPHWEEIKNNKRARSALLRVVERTTPIM